MGLLGRFIAATFAAGICLACGDVSPETARNVPVRVDTLALDPLSGSPVLLLEEQAGPRSLAIWIGFPEARSIAAQIDHVQPPRPNTHDMAKRLVDGLHGVLERAVVTELRNGIYFAVLTIRSGGELVELDVRPSDAVALALRTNSPIFVREPLLEEDRLPLEPGGDPGREASLPPPRYWSHAGIPPATSLSARPFLVGNLLTQRTFDPFPH